VLSTQAGQAVYANFATAYALIPELRIGLDGYWFDQITDTKVNATNAPGRRERVWALGPGALLSVSSKDFLFANVYFEQDAP
jgi:anthranilate 1,2-dioxygenase (deaminating, decarboxylating) large subunit